MTPEFVQTAWARLLMSTLVRSGICNIVLSPGSRSTPFVVALFNESSVRITVAIDERSAGFIALGMARRTFAPTLLISTSGTAAANYLPAVVEANLAGVPLIVLTADRPVELHHAGAPQTIDQTKLYGSHVRRFVEVGDGPTSVRALRSFRRLVVDAVQLAVNPRPGPVHINARARLPLEPVAAIDSDERDFEQTIDTLLREPWPQVFSPEVSPGSGPLESLAELCNKTRRGLILCGFDAQPTGLEPDLLAMFARATGYPVWFDPSHPLRWQHPDSLAPYVVRCADLLWQLEDFVLQHRPQLIVQIGPGMTNRHLDHWLRDVGAEIHIVVTRDGWPDSLGKSQYLVQGDPSRALERLAKLIGGMQDGLLGGRPWFLEWSDVDSRGEQLLDEWLEQQHSRISSELSIVRWVLDACPSATQLVLGNSLPIREAGDVCPAANRGLCVFANRGANGIDGIVSTAVGVALASRAPTLALVGDISFLHDLGALWAARSLESPLW